MPRDSSRIKFTVCTCHSIPFSLTMCGIFGVVASEAAAVSAVDLFHSARDLMRLSESRGQEAAGVALMNASSIRVFKQPVSGSSLFRSPSIRNFFNAAMAQNVTGVTVIGHARLATDGGLEQRDNNQPIVSDGIVGIHNGIVVNVASLWTKYAELERRFQVDTEVILSLLRLFLKRGAPLPKALGEVFSEIVGVANIALLFRERNQVVLATNNGSLYIASAPDSSVLAFASEQHIIQKFISAPSHKGRFGGLEVSQLGPGEACIIDAGTIQFETFNYRAVPCLPDAWSSNGFDREITDLSGRQLSRASTARLVAPSHSAIPSWIDEAWENNRRAIAQLRRCTRCVLPETVPLLDFDEHGVCCDCRNYVPRTFLGEDALQEAVRRFRRTDGRPEVLMSLSGGRDSCYALHYVKKTLGLKTLAYTYDWGMVTDLARRNQSRLCSKLGIEHIWVSANISRKREHIRKNVQAWLRKPQMGLIPLFMAGDKQLFYYFDRVAKDNDIDLTIFSLNSLEHTDFRSGYCGTPRGTRGDWSGSGLNLRMLAYYLRSFVTNPRYLNSSLGDTMCAYIIYYFWFKPGRVLGFHDYIQWDEQTVVSTLREEYDWEISPDTTSTWRIGDGTAPFYNYIDYTVGGFTEIDTFRSNQIRAGVLDRATALALVNRENTLRYDSIKWYCDTIGIDMHSAMRVINGIPKRYSAD